jgi:hypothetical protein
LLRLPWPSLFRQRRALAKQQSDFFFEYFMLRFQKKKQIHQAVLESSAYFSDEDFASAIWAIYRITRRK